MSSLHLRRSVRIAARQAAAKGRRAAPAAADAAAGPCEHRRVAAIRRRGDTNYGIRHPVDEDIGRLLLRASGRPTAVLPYQARLLPPDLLLPAALLILLLLPLIVPLLLLQLPAAAAAVTAVVAVLLLYLLLAG